MGKDYFPTLASAAASQLKPLGFIRKERGIFMRSLTADVMAWLGLGHGYYAVNSVGHVSLKPIIGVRNEPVERLVAQFAPRQFSRNQPSAKIDLESLRPASIRGDIWINGPQFIEVAARTLAERVRDVGLPYAQSLVALDDLIRVLASVPDEGARIRLPIALWLAGKPAEARYALESALASISGRKGPAADEFRAFAAAFDPQLSTGR
jgi:hypothetical protein